MRHRDSSLQSALFTSEVLLLEVCLAGLDPAYMNAESNLRGVWPWAGDYVLDVKVWNSVIYQSHDVSASGPQSL